MDEGKQERIAAAAREGNCPECGCRLDRDRIGSGRLADGVFCSLDCLASFHVDYFESRRRASAPSEN
jgi:hypothetical protein